MTQPTSGDFTKTAGWLDWYAGPSKPRFQLPPGSVDALAWPMGDADASDPRIMMITPTSPSRTAPIIYSIRRFASRKNMIASTAAQINPVRA